MSAYFSILFTRIAQRENRITKNFELSVQPANKRQSEEMKMKLFFHFPLIRSYFSPLKLHYKSFPQHKTTKHSHRA